MSIVVNVNGESINYPQTGDTNWGDEATDFAVQTSSALAKVGLSTGTTVDLPGTLDVTGNTTLDANLSVGGNASVTGTTSLTGNVTLTNNLTVNGNTQLGNANTDTINVTGIVNVDSGVLYVDPTNNRVGIVNSSPSKALDVTGEIQSSSHITCNGVVYADDDTTANTPVISFIGDTNTGIGRSAADTLDLITNGNSRFRIESTGQIKAVYESTLGTDYNTTLHNGYLCRAWINFDGSSSNLSGTYSRTGTTITVSITSHGLSTGQSVYLDFTTGTGTDGIYIVTVVNANSYTVTDTVSGSTSGNVTQFRYIRASGNVSSITDNGAGSYSLNFTTAMPDTDYSVFLCSNGNTTENWSYVSDTYSTASVRCLIGYTPLGTTTFSLTDRSIVTIGIFR